MVFESTWWSSATTSGDRTTVRCTRSYERSRSFFRVLAVEPGDRQLIRVDPEDHDAAVASGKRRDGLELPRFCPASAGSWRLYSSCDPSPAARSAATLARGSDGTAISTPARARSPVHPDPGSIER